MLIVIFTLLLLAAALRMMRVPFASIVRLLNFGCLIESPELSPIPASNDPDLQTSTRKASGQNLAGSRLSNPVEPRFLIGMLLIPQ